MPASNLPPGAAPPPKKGGALKWILIGCGSIVVLGAIAMTMTGLFVAKKMADAGLDPELMEKNPGLAVTKMMAAMNPDVEVVRVDEGRGTVTLREKSTGKTVTMRFDDVKKGRITFESDEGKMEISGDESGIKVTTPEGTAEFGAGAGKFPSWLPEYSPIRETAGGITSPKGGMVNFTTDDSVDDVAEFYESAMKSAGLKIRRTVTETDGQKTVSLHGEEGGRNATVTASVQDGVTQVVLLHGSN
jgi:hypothetical protein